MPGSEYEFTPLRFTNDAMFISSLVMVPGLIYCHYWIQPYDLSGLILGSLCSVLVTGGGISVGKALAAGGKGGPTQSVENLKILIPLVIWCFIRAELPTTLQMAGMTLCLVATWVVGIFQ
jgi:hypothetical protein